MTPGDRIREERLLRGMSQAKLGHVADVTKQAVSRIELGHTKKPEAETLEPISRALGLNLRWVLDETPPKYISPAAIAPADAHTDTPAQLGDIRAILTMVVQALGTAIPAAGVALADKLDDPDSPFRDRAYAQDVLAALDTVLPPQARHGRVPPRHKPTGR